MPARKVIARNKKASFNYEFEDKFEAGIILSGSEIKSIRAGKVNIEDAHADINGDEIFIHNMYIAEYDKANRFNHQTRRPRKLLLHKQQIRKLNGKVKIKGYSIVPTSIYLNERNIAKLEIALARGKKLHDKRQSLKDKDWQREQGRILKNR